MGVFKLKELQDYSNKHREAGLKIGLVVGCFDVLHLGHLNLFRLAKEHVDVLIVGLDCDETIKLTKGTDRPINNISRRLEFLQHITLIDDIFISNKVVVHGSAEARDFYKKLLQKIKPTHIFTHKVCDTHWKDKKDLAKKKGIKIIIEETKRVTNSSNILAKLEQEL